MNPLSLRVDEFQTKSATVCSIPQQRAKFVALEPSLPGSKQTEENNQGVFDRPKFSAETCKS